MAYRNLENIRHFLHTVCSNVLRLPPIGCRIVQQTQLQHGAYFLSMREIKVYSFMQLLYVYSCACRK